MPLKYFNDAEDDELLHRSVFTMPPPPICPCLGPFLMRKILRTQAITSLQGGSL